MAKISMGMTRRSGKSSRITSHLSKEEEGEEEEESQSVYHTLGSWKKEELIYIFVTLLPENCKTEDEERLTDVKTYIDWGGGTPTHQLGNTRGVFF